MFSTPSPENITLAQTAVTAIDAALAIYDAKTNPLERDRYLTQDLQALVVSHGPLIRTLLAAELAAAKDAAETALADLCPAAVTRARIINELSAITDLRGRQSTAAGGSPVQALDVLRAGLPILRDTAAA